MKIEKLKYVCGSSNVCLALTYFKSTDEVTGFILHVCIEVM